jgi:hypothetical protein
MFHHKGIVTSISKVGIGLWRIRMQSDGGPDVMFGMKSSQCYISRNDRIRVFIGVKIYGGIRYAYKIYNITRGKWVL